MRKVIITLLYCAFVAAQVGLCQNEPMPVSVVQLLNDPQKFADQQIELKGFLVIGRELRHGPEAYLYLHQEDAKNMLVNNGMRVVPSTQMMKDMEKINRVYVTMIGTVHASPTAVGTYVPSIENVQSCAMWSDPGHPIGEPSSSTRKDSH